MRDLVATKCFFFCLETWRPPGHFGRPVSHQVILTPPSGHQIIFVFFFTLGDLAITKSF